MLDLYESAVSGKSLAGFKLGQSLSELANLADSEYSSSDAPPLLELMRQNNGVFLYVLRDGGALMYFSSPCLELHFNKDGALTLIKAGKGFKGEIFNGVKIGDPIRKIDHPLYLDTAEDRHYLCDENEDILPGVFFYAEGESVDEYPNQIIKEVSVYE